MERYLQSCKTDFWKKVFKAESDYILSRLKETKDVLSVGCGPAVIEKTLADYGFNITGLDISEEAIGQAPDNIRKAIGTAEKMVFADCSFDAVIYVASLQFIEKYRNAIKETVRVLRPAGRLLVMLINPQSEFFKEKTKNPHSYINRIKHTDLKKIEKAVSEYFTIETEYFLGIEGTQVLPADDANSASLYVINGFKRNTEKQTNYMN